MNSPRLQSADDFAFALAPSSVHTPRSGAVHPAMWQALLAEAQREVRRPFHDLIEQKAICFCFPEPPLIYPCTHSEARSLWENRATLAIQGLECRSGLISRISTRIGQLLDRRITCSIYLSQVLGRSFSWHTDAWDSLLFQLDGDKAFDLELDGRVCTYLQRPATWLRIASSEPHRATATSPLSIHMVFGSHHDSAIPLLRQEYHDSLDG